MKLKRQLTKPIFLAGCFLLGIAPVIAGNASKTEKYVLTDQKLFPIPLQDVRLLDSPFKKAMELDGKWLLSLQPDRLLSGFRSSAGLTPKGEKYGGWESGGVAGQTLGHYLSACAMIYAATGDPRYKEQIVYTVNELDTCQQANGNGLLAGFPRAKGVFDEIAAGDIRTQGFDLNGGWVPLYTMHKLFAGLIDVYNYTGNQQAFDLVVRLSDWFVATFAHLSEEQIQKILVCEHGGINESLANVYALTGNKKYLEIAQRFNHKTVLDPLSQGVDELAGKHANTQIPKVIGTIREFELTQDSTFYHTADFFWNTVIHNHSYVIGGNSEAEHFGMPGRTYDRITDKTCENCNTYNMLKLTKHLYQLAPTIEQVDYYERALYNQILASQNPADGMVCYMSPLSPRSHRGYSSPFDSFWCCVGTGLENHTRYGEFIYFTDARKDLYVNLFIPSQLNWKERDITLSQQTRFPESDTIVYRFDMKKSQRFTLNLRTPAWAVKGYNLYINGKLEKNEVAPGKYTSITRRWKNGDQVMYVLPKEITSEAALGDPTLRAYLYGPIVLATVLPDDQPIPSVLISSDTHPFEVMRPIANDPLRFTAVKAEPWQPLMLPYYQTGNQRMMVYFSHYAPEVWAEKKDGILQQQNHEEWLKQNMISHFRPGEMQPERDHNFVGEQTEPGQMEGRKYRKANEGGWFSFTMDVKPDTPLNLLCTYWGNLGDKYKFRILVDETVIATAIIHWWGNSFIEKSYRIPEELTKGKNAVTVKFQALDDRSIAGPLFDCKVVKQ